MLVLSRKPGQKILIGDDIVVSINRVSGNQVSIGVQAPDRIRILRAELQPIVDSFAAEEDQEAEGAEAHFAAAGALI
jgi:carbon storage regulator